LDTLSNGGFICEGCCVLADGVFMDGVFQVEAFAHPPTEPRITTQEYLQEVNLFGGDHYSTEAQEDELEEQLSRLMIIMSDVHLDNPTVMEKFRTLLEGYAMMEPPPSCFVLLGNFFSQPVGVSGGVGMQTASQYFSDLGAMVNEFPELVEATEFVLVPGPSDPGPTPGLIPRPPLPSCFTAGVSREAVAGWQATLTRTLCQGFENSCQVFTLAPTPAESITAASS
jgi:DNA polymerase epsilon subunit 2